MQFEPLVGDMWNKERHDIGYRKCPARQATLPRGGLGDIFRGGRLLPDDRLYRVEIQANVAMLAVKIISPRDDIEAMQIGSDVECDRLIITP